MKYSLNDIYPHSTNVLTTSEQTVAGDIETNVTNVNESGQKSSLNKSMIFGAVILIVGLMFSLHFLGGE